MEFRTIVDLPRGLAVEHDEPIMLLGSCFSDNIGERLRRALFRVDVNPFGTLYNPASIAAAVRRLMENRPYSEAELFEFGGMWHSFDHHSKFSCADRSMALQKINARYEGGVQFLKTARWLIVTFGTAYAYCLSDTGAVAGNCHKMPASCFSRRLLPQRDVVDDWLATLACLHEWNPELKAIFTVSPIRHLADGAHGNQLSKSTLLLAIDELSRHAEWISYFPAFEIVMDELRDYRFYAADMVHPSDVAVDYVMERFSEACFSESAEKMPYLRFVLKELFGDELFDI